jgi:hypothetical protein
MSLDRRNFIKLTAAIGAGSAFAGACASASKNKSQATVVLPSGMVTADDIANQLTEHLDKRGFTAHKPEPFVTGHAFNGGLQFDDNITSIRPATYVLQPAARVEDAQKRHTPGTLPIFTLFAIMTATDAKETACIDIMMNYLQAEVGLDPKRLSVTTTERARHLFAQFAAHGISTDRIRIRAWEEAQASGSGSGYFCPVGHPRAPSFESFSLEYTLSDGTELEIVECLYAGARHPVNVCFGVERLAMAHNDRAMLWSDMLPAFKKAVEEDAKARGLALPPGYYEILGISPAKA